MTSLAKLIARLTRGYIKETGRAPTGLDKLRIKMEAAEQLRQANKVIRFPQQRSFKQEIETMIDDGTIKIGQVDKINDNVRTRQMFKKSNLNKTEDQIKKEIEASNKKGLASMRKKLDDPEEKANGGRIGLAGGSDMGTVADSKGKTGPSKGGYQGGGTGPIDDRSNERQNFTQNLVRAGYTPKEINKITNPNAFDKLRSSRFNNPFTRGILRTGMYALNPSLGIIDARTALQINDILGYAKDQINNPVDEEDLTLGMITDQQKGIIDKQGQIGKLTGAFDPNQTFDAAKQFDDKGSKGVFGIGAKDPEPMSRKEFDSYVKQKGYATGGIARAGFVGGGMGRRAFLKLLGMTGAGIAGAKTGLMSLAKKSEPVVEAVKETAQEVPSYFFSLVNKIRTLGDDTLASQDKAVAKKYKDYVMEEDFAGNIEIMKKGEDIAGNKTQDVYMSYKVDEIPLKKGGSRKVEEYEEFTARPDMEGKMKDIEQGVPDNVVEEAMSQAPSIKKASGGIARMLGE
jgi:hypothetical protein